MLPEQDLRKGKKQLRTWYLDNQGGMKTNLCCFFVLVSLLLIVSVAYFRASASCKLDISILEKEMDSIRMRASKETSARQDIQQQLFDTELLLRSKEQVIKSQEEMLLLKEASLRDLRAGLSALEESCAQAARAPPMAMPPYMANPVPAPVRIPAPVPQQAASPFVPPSPAPVAQQLAPVPVPAPVQVPAQQPAARGPSTADVAKQAAVKESMKFAWESYKKYAWGKDDLKPISKSFANWLDLGVTIVDALDTLWIMGFRDEFQEGRDWVAENLSFDKSRDISVFETTIRELGGLLSAYEFSKDKVFLDKAEDLADRLMPAFDSPTGIPYATVNLKSGRATSPSWTGGASVLSEMGTLQLEFLYLAYHTNKPKYAIKALDVFRHLDSLEKDNGLYPLYVHPRTGEFQGREVSMGALGDSFYEYELKMWLFTNKQADGYRRMYEESMKGVLETLIQTSASGYKFMGQIGRSGKVEQKMEHLACFSGGMLALGADHHAVSNAAEQLNMGAEITTTCYQAYNRTATGIGPEVFEFPSGREFVVPPRAKHYLLRPEVVESYFVLWRTTHDERFRTYAWQAYKNIEKYCRTPDGYSGIRDVDNTHAAHDDTMQSFFLAETLKYLYLIFSDDDVVSLDDYVFNTEAHPLGLIKEPLETWPQELRFHLIEA